MKKKKRFFFSNTSYSCIKLCRGNLKKEQEILSPRVPGKLCRGVPLDAEVVAGAHGDHFVDEPTGVDERRLGPLSADNDDIFSLGDD